MSESLSEEERRAASRDLLLERLDRVRQQLDSFRKLHSADLHGVEKELRDVSSSESAQKLAALIHIHTDEIELLESELSDTIRDLRAYLNPAPSPTRLSKAAEQ